MFTANPVTGRRDEVVIDASSGLGEAVVSGLVTPDHYVLDARGAIRQRTPGRREVVIRGVDGGGLAQSTDERPDPLPDPALVELATLGRAVAAHFGRPQDIEWARAGGRAWLLQARPMTALPPPPLRLGRARRRQGQQLLDYFTERPYPMDVSAWIRPGIGNMVERMLLEIPGLRVDMSELLPEIDGVVDQFVPPRPRPTRAMLTAPARLTRRIRRFTPAAWDARSTLPPVPPGGPGARLDRPGRAGLDRSDRDRAPSPRHRGSDHRRAGGLPATVRLRPAAPARHAGVARVAQAVSAADRRRQDSHRGRQPARWRNWPPRSAPTRH